MSGAPNFSLDRRRETLRQLSGREIAQRYIAIKNEMSSNADAVRRIQLTVELNELRKLAQEMKHSDTTSVSSFGSLTGGVGKKSTASAPAFRHVPITKAVAKDKMAMRPGDAPLRPGAHREASIDSTVGAGPAAEQSPAYIERMLLDFHEVKDRDTWSGVKPGSLIRYFSDDGTFRVGGFLAFIRLSAKDGGMQYVLNATNYGKRKQYTVGFARISRLYVREPAAPDARPARAITIDEVVSHVAELRKALNEVRRQLKLPEMPENDGVASVLRRAEYVEKQASRGRGRGRGYKK